MIMRERSAVFAAAARNCAAHLPGVLDNLARFGSIYGSRAFIFVVSDSSDGTADLLRQWLAARAWPGKVVDLGNVESRLTLRTQRIAYARNVALEQIGEHWAGYDHLVVADLDDVLAAPVSIATFSAAAAWLDAVPSRAGVFANSKPRYYDIWALRHANWCPGDCWHPIWNRPAWESFEAAKFREVFARQIIIPRTLPPIPVQSAFGGLGIYRLPSALLRRYCGLDADGRETSEHVIFNRGIRDTGGHLYIYPALQVHAPEQHLYQSAHFTWPWRLRMITRDASARALPPWRRFLS